MPANTAPIFTVKPDLSTNGTTGMSPTLTTAAADFVGTNANNALVFTAGADGAYVRKIHFKAIGTNVQSVARIYLNNGSTNATATNNALYGEVQLPASTAGTNSPTGVEVDYVMEIAIPAGWRIYVGLGTTVAAGWVVTAVAGSY